VRRGHHIAFPIVTYNDTAGIHVPNVTRNHCT